MTKTEQNQIAKALIRVFELPAANIVDTLDDIARGLLAVVKQLKIIANKEK